MQEKQGPAVVDIPCADGKAGGHQGNPLSCVVALSGCHMRWRLENPTMMQTQTN